MREAELRLRDTRARAVRNANLEYEEREQLDSGIDNRASIIYDSGGGGALSQGAGHDGSFF